MSIFARIGEAYKREGAWGVCLRILKKSCRVFFETNSAIWLERDLLKELPPKIAVNIPLEINLSAPEELINWVKSYGERWMCIPEEVEVGLAHNHYFSIAKSNGRIVAYCRVGINKVYIADYREIISLEPGAAFICERYVAPDFRNQNIATFLEAKLMQELKESGYRKILCHVPPWNKSSLKVSEKLGFRKSVYTRHFRIFSCFKFYIRKKC